MCVRTQVTDLRRVLMQICMYVSLCANACMCLLIYYGHNRGLQQLVGSIK